MPKIFSMNTALGVVRSDRSGQFAYMDMDIWFIVIGILLRKQIHIYIYKYIDNKQTCGYLVNP